MATNISVTELDFATTKQNIKEFLSSQSEFTDFDFDGSAISVLLDALAYASHIVAIQANMTFNEMFLDSATLRNSVISRAKELNYVPRSETAAKATIRLNIADALDPASITIPRGTKFSSVKDGTTYIFSTVDDQTLSRISAGNYQGDIDIYQGEYKETTWNVSNIVDGVIQDRFIIQDDNVDTRFLSLEIEAIKGSESITWTLTDDITESSPTSTSFFIQEIENNQHEIYFGAGLIGAQPILNNYIRTTYLTTDGIDGNAIKNFSIISTVTSNGTNYQPNDFTISIVTKSFGGRDRESISEIKVMAPKFYETQGRAVTINDYRILMLKEFPEIETMSIWGGEDEVPAQYGKVFMAIKPIYGTSVSPATIETMENYLKRKNVVGVIPEITTPQYVYVNIISTVKFDGQNTSLSEGQIETAIRLEMYNYIDNLSEVFDQGISYSPTVSKIDSIHDSIESNDTYFTLSHKITPLTTVNNSYSLDYANTLKPTTLNAEWIGVDAVTRYSLKDDSNGVINLYVNDIFTTGNIGSINYVSGIVAITNFIPDIVANTQLSITVQPFSNDLLSRRRALLIAGDMTGIELYDTSKVGGSLEDILLDQLTDEQKIALGL